MRRDRNNDTSNHLRELLRLREDETGNVRNVPSRTLGSVLYTEKRNLSNRTLLDIIREDSTKDNKNTWKHFKDKLRLKRAGAAWTSSVRIPASDVYVQPNNNSSSSNSMNNRMMIRRHSARIPASDPDSTQNPATNQPPMLQSTESSAAQNNGHSAAAEEPPEIVSEEEEGMGETVEGDGPDGEGGPVRMSLMALLAETDREMGIEGLYDDDDEEVEEEEEESGGRNGGAGEYNNCCVCMVRHKGAALIPCGHTFCRLCSRELWVQRGNCPLCNGYILEILDIF